MLRPMNTKTSNQQNPPLPKKKRVDKNGNDRRRVFAKSGTATLLLAKGLTQNAAIVFTEKIREHAEKLGGESCCDFLITK